MLAERFDFDVGGLPSAATLFRVPAGRALIVLAHGAGGRQDHPWMVAAAQALALRGMHVATFDFLYTHARRRVPDRNDVLEATWIAALASVRARLDVAPIRLFIGGKSMGGRIATQVAAKGLVQDLSGLVLLGYPLHPPGKPDKLRAAHLERVSAPMLFVQGSRDVFGRPDELGPILAPLSGTARLFAIEGADHSLSPKRGRGGEQGDLIDRIADEIVRFVGPAVTGQ